MLWCCSNIVSIVRRTKSRRAKAIWHKPPRVQCPQQGVAMTPDNTSNANQQRDAVAERMFELASIQSPFLEGLPREKLTALLNKQERRSFSPGTQVLVQGERLQELYLIVAGL